VRTPSWIESPTALEVTEAKVLLAEVCLLKERGLTAKAVVADFVFKNIEPRRTEHTWLTCTVVLPTPLGLLIGEFLLRIW
jgi:hypothetical protein